MIYGPGDRLHRFRPLLRQMEENPARVEMEEDWADWKSPRGHVENVAVAIAVAAASEAAAGRLYNVAEQPAFTELEWACKIGGAAGWSGEFALVPKARAGNAGQHWHADSSRIRRELGYVEPVPMDDAIRRTVAWEKAENK